MPGVVSIRPMKTTISVLSAVLSLMFIASPDLFAASGGAVSPRGSLFSFESPKAFSIGAFYENAPTEVEIAGYKEKAIFQHMYGVVGLDVAKWLTLRLHAGTTITGDDGDKSRLSGSAYGGGFTAKLIEYEIEKTRWMEGIWRIELHGDFTKHDSSEGGNYTDWDETFGSLTWNWEIFGAPNSLEMEPCHSLVLFAGSGYSGLDGNVKSGNYRSAWHANRDFGFVGGVELFLTKNLSFGWELRDFEYSTYLAHVGYHF